MSIIQGIGDEVAVFGAFILTIILAAIIIFIFIETPFNTSSSQDILIDSNSNELISDSGSSPNIECSPNDENRESTTGAPNLSSNHVEETPDLNAMLMESIALICPHIEAIAESEEQSLEEEQTNTPIYPTTPDPFPPSAPPEEESEMSTEQENLEPGQIHVRLKSLDDTERTVISRQTAKMIDFKRAHFPDDIANNRTVRLIFSGQLLQDNATLQSYGISENCVIHVQILSAQIRQNVSQYSQNGDLDLSHLLWPLMSVILGICWILYFKYPEFFNMMSLGILFLFTGSFVYFYSQVHNR